MISYAPLFQTMKNRGISTYRLGKLGFPMSTYYAMRRGDNISTHTLNQLCKLLQCKVENFCFKILFARGLRPTLTAPVPCRVW